MSEVFAFLAFKSRPNANSLVDLLRAYQDRLFRLCFQVLHNAHDAEDAAQEVLLKIPAEVSRFEDPEAFRRWLNRVVLNAALESARKSGRRRSHETRAAMERPAQAPIDAADRLALFEAIAALDEGQRNLVLDHYFEGESQESLAEREGCSAPAVCKRLEIARESMRRILGGVAAVAVLPGLERLFPAAPATPDLVSGAVLAQVQSIAAIAAGGTIVAAKSSVVGISVAVALACFVVGAGTGAVLKGRSGRAKVEDLERRLVAAEKGSIRPALPSETTTLPALNNPAPENAAVLSPKEAVASKLHAKLSRYRKWIEAYFRESEEMSKSNPEGFAAFRAQKMAELGELLVGMRELVCASPQEFLEFLRDSKNENYLRSLILRGLGFYENDTRSHSQEFSFFPRELNDGMMDLLKSGSPAQKRAMLQYFELVFNQPADFRAAYPQLLEDPDPSFQMQVVNVIARTASWTDESFTAVTRLGQTATYSDLKMAIANGMSWVNRPEAITYLIDRLEATGDYMEVISVAQTLDMKLINRQGISTSEQQDRVERAVLSAIGKGFDGATYLVVIRAGLALPAEKLKPILQQALAQAPTDHSRKTIENLIQLVNAGQSTASDLRKASWGEK